MSEVKPVAIVFCLRGESYAGGHFIEVQLRITPGIDLPIGTRLYDERVVVELLEKFDEQVQITARIANENASNRLRAERAEARVAELEADARRYRFLRDKCNHNVRGWHIQFSTTAADLDAAIDAARQQEDRGGMTDDRPPL